VGDCEADCGETGVAVRDVRCAKVPFDVSQTAAYIDDQHCRHLANVRPSDTVDCTGSCIETHWIYSTWSEVGQWLFKPAFYDADTDTDILADIFAKIVARMSACRKFVIQLATGITSGNRACRTYRRGSSCPCRCRCRRRGIPAYYVVPYRLTVHYSCRCIDLRCLLTSSYTCSFSAVLSM